jgi:hypothetical protein
MRGGYIFVWDKESEPLVGVARARGSPDASFDCAEMTPMHHFRARATSTQGLTFFIPVKDMVALKTGAASLRTVLEECDGDVAARPCHQHAHLGSGRVVASEQRHRLCSGIWYEVVERWCKATMRPSPTLTVVPAPTASPNCPWTSPPPSEVLPGRAGSSVIKC